MLLILIGVAFATALLYVWNYLNNANKYWEERGIPFKKPILFFGNSWPTISRKVTPSKNMKDLYDSFPESKFFGFFDFMKPSLIVKDLELVERILIKDFHHFVDRGFGNPDKDTAPIDVNLFNMTGKRWKAMRNKFSPMFTTGKLRHMVPQIRDISNVLIAEFENNRCDVDLRDMFQRFSMDVIASCAFGINLNAIQEKEESEFRRMGKLAFKLTPMQVVRFVLLISFPKIAKKLKVAQNNPAVAKFYSKVLLETLTYRKSNNLKRNDFVQLMVTLQQKGAVEFEGDESDDYLKIESEENTEKQIETIELTDDVMVGQAFVFLVAGFEGKTYSHLKPIKIGAYFIMKQATATALTFLFYELASNPETQEKAREEIIRVVKARKGVLDYDTLREMTYLSQCVQETLRMHTFVPGLFRVCTKEYTFPGTSLTIKPGQTVIIPVGGIHEDPEIYPEPEKFKPERFDPDIKVPSCAYLPFGDGPRICIAMRFAQTEIKLCAAKVLLDYFVNISSKTKLPIEYDPANFANAPKNPLYFNFTKANVEQKI